MKTRLLLILLALASIAHAQRQNIEVGASANDGTGDSLRAAGIKINANFVELYGGGYVYAMPALEMNMTAANTKTLSANSTITFGTAPTKVLQPSSLTVTNTNASPITITLPANVVDSLTGDTVSTFPVQGAGVNNGRRTVGFRWLSGTTYELIWIGAKGDVTAAASFNNDNRLLRSDGTGKGAQASGITVNDDDDLSGINELSAAIASVGDQVYGAGWNASTEVPTKNAIYDKIESLVQGLSVGTYTGTAAYAAGGLYVGALDGDDDISSSTLTSGQRHAFLLDVQGAPRTIDFDSALRVYADGGAITEYTFAQDGWVTLEFIQTATTLYVIIGEYELVDIATDVSGLAAGVATALGTPSSANLRSAVTDEVGTGALMFTRTGVRRTIYVGAGAMIPRTTNGAATATVELATNDVMFDSLDFDQTTEEGAGFWLTLPSTWDASTVTAKFHWTASTGSGTVKWDIAARSFADDDAMDQAMGTEQTASADTLLATGDMHISGTTPALTVGGTPAANRPIYWQVTRDVAGDTLSGDARLLGVTIEYVESTTEPSAQ